MAKKNFTPLTPREWNKIIHLANQLSQTLRKAKAREVLSQFHKKYPHPGAENPEFPRSLIEPTGKPSVGRKRIKEAVKRSRN